MIDEKLDFRLLKFKNGKPFFAIVNLEVYRSDIGNEIIEEYCGEGWLRQGNIESVPMKGYEDWKKGVKNGLEFALSKSSEKWKVKIKKVEGRIGTDTNPTIIGFATILAFCEQTKLKLDSEIIEKIENFTFKSWENKNDEKIPNFINLEYER
ncbi:hypothetical protein Q361_1392 [Flavobacterium croceum DSM 17960]|uniref:Uncharacterized protein n=1 Tax=Flavobacterium croceum DSM 17960 TaxID=1121886 RepID=A0A2S4N4G6_9FLAO|nr:hypothetical protein [Flavobacterium croceum]POS00629.1 hypothetical protein Q361_1392 [Flavobacterium croceum DSM 17960]